jgi:hypothetical protein
MLADGDKKSNEIFDACVKAGIATAMMQYVKKTLSIKSVRKIDDWYWTLDSDTLDAEDDSFNTEPDEPDNSFDEIPVTFLDEPLSTKIPVIKNITNIKPQVIPQTKPLVTVMQSPFGELKLIDWRAYA